MRIGKTEYYALVFLEQLKRKDRVALSDVSLQFDVPLNFLYKIALKLKNSGIIESKEGVDGGYSLVKKFENISLYDILSSLKKDSESYCSCKGGVSCSRHSICEVYANLKDELDTKLKEITLDTL